MPTIHLSIPSRVYDELKREAESYGMQITDVVKFFIREGLERRKEKLRRIKGESEKVEILEMEIMYLKDIVEEMFRMIEDLKESIEEIRSPVIEPEIVGAESRS